MRQRHSCLNDYAHWSSFIEGDLYQSWLKEVEDKAGISVLGSIPDMPRGSFRTLVSSKPINSADDINGLKIRQYQNELVIDAWGYLGAEVRVLPWAEVYDGINRGIVESVGRLRSSRSSPCAFTKWLPISFAPTNIRRPLHG